MNGQDPNQNLNNINPDPNVQAPVVPNPEVPAAPAAAPTPAPAPMPEAAPAPVADPNAMTTATAAPTPAPIPAEPAVAPAPAPVNDMAGIMPDAVMPNPVPAQVPAAEPAVAPVMPEAAPAPAPAPVNDMAGIMPDAAMQTPQAPVVDPNATIMPNTNPAVAAVDPMAASQGQIPNPVGPTPDAANGAQGQNGEQPVKKGIAIDKNIIIIVVGLLIIAIVLFFSWKNGLIFKKKTPAPATNNVVTPAPENKTPEPEKPKQQNQQEAKAKLNEMSWLETFIAENYEDIEDGEDITENVDKMLDITYILYVSSSASYNNENLKPQGICDKDAEVLPISDVNKIILKVFDEELANKNLTASDDIYSKEEYAKLKSTSTCLNAKSCEDAKNCKITESYALFETKDETSNPVKVTYDGLSYDLDENIITGVVTLDDEDETTWNFEIVIDDADLVKSITFTK